jgi:outer membrane protein assembly factor BamB
MCFLRSLVACLSLVPFAAATPIEEGSPRPFVCADYTQGRIFIVDRTGRVTWEYPAENCNDLWVLPDGGLLFSTGHGVRELGPDRSVRFAYDSSSEIYACQRLANGNTFVGECNSGRLLELSPSGRVIKEVRLLPPGEDGGHAFMRNARRLPNGHYLVAHYGLGLVREYDAAGRIVLEIPAPGGPHSVIRLPDGNTLVSCADRNGISARVFEYDSSGKTVWELRAEDLPRTPLFFLGGLQRLANGNTVLTNWLGHGHFGEGPVVVEVTREKRVVWTFSDHEKIRTASTIQVLDVPGDAVKGEIWH